MFFFFQQGFFHCNIQQGVFFIAWCQMTKPNYAKLILFWNVSTFYYQKWVCMSFGIHHWQSRTKQSSPNLRTQGWQWDTRTGIFMEIRRCSFFGTSAPTAEAATEAGQDALYFRGFWGFVEHPLGWTWWRGTPHWTPKWPTEAFLTIYNCIKGQGP